MVFTGTYEHAIDSKQRLAIPSELRSRLRDRSQAREEEPIHVYVLLGETDALFIYAEPDFERWSREMMDMPIEADDELVDRERLLFSLTKRVELDKQGRVRLPENLVAKVGLSCDVVVIGNNDHIEIRDRAAWTQQVDEALEKQPELLASFRKALRRGPRMVRDD